MRGACRRAGERTAPSAPPPPTDVDTSSRSTVAASTSTSLSENCEAWTRMRPLRAIMEQPS